MWPTPDWARMKDEFLLWLAIQVVIDAVVYQLPYYNIFM
jgi:hypothetical protein